MARKKPVEVPLASPAGSGAASFQARGLRRAEIAAGPKEIAAWKIAAIQAGLPLTEWLRQAANAALKGAEDP